MRSIGIRAAPSVVTFAVFDQENQAILNVEGIKVPAAFSIPDALKYIRNNLLDVLREYDISLAGVRVMEPNAQSPNIARVQIEGVIQEAFASSALTGYYVGQISSISSRVGIPREDFRKYVSGQMSFDRVENWGSLSEPEREAVLCAIGAFND